MGIVLQDMIVMVFVVDLLLWMNVEYVQEMDLPALVVMELLIVA